ncbi:MAG: helix-turn-helix domain-containing protein [Acetatifactor muris]|nr:helix-turn-helix domain-containing protein [Acetatifactor muris]
MDRLLLTALLQRLGFSSDIFAALLTKREYTYFDWRQQLSVAQIDRDWQKVMALLREEAGRKPVCNPAIQEQFFSVIQVRAKAELSGDKGDAAELYQEAVQRTVPDFPRQLGAHTYLSIQEINIMLLWSDSCRNREDAAKVLLFLEGYIPARFSQEREKVKLYPRVAARYLPILYEQGMYHECMAMAEKAMNMIVTFGYIPGMEAVLDSYVKTAECLGMEKQVHNEKMQLNAWQELMQELGQTGEKFDDELYMTDTWQDADLLGELLSRNRRYRGYSQEELSAGICTPETLSRIETGRRAPNTGTFRALAKKLDLREDYYYNNIEANDFALFNLEWQITTLIMNKKWEQAEAALKRMKEELDLSYDCNRQYVEIRNFTIDCESDRIPPEQQFERARKILSITLKKVPKNVDVRKWSEDFWSCPFSREEIGVMIKMADTLINEKKEAQAEYLLKKLLRHYQSSKVRQEFHFEGVIMLMARLAECAGRLKKWKEELDYSEDGIRLCRAGGTGKILPLFLSSKADALEHLGEEETSLKYYEFAFYSADLFRREQTAQVAKESYEKLLGRSREWY